MIQGVFSALRSRVEALALYFGALCSFGPSLFHSISLFARGLQCTLACVLDIFAGCCGCEPDLRSRENTSGKIDLDKEDSTGNDRPLSSSVEP